MINNRWIIAVTVILFALTCVVMPVYSDNQTPPIPFAAIQNGELMLYNSGSGALKVKNPEHTAISKAVWSPDGNHIAYLLIDMATHAQVMVANTQTGESLELKAGSIEGGFPFNFTSDGKLIYVVEGVTSSKENGYVVSVYSISLTANAVPQKLGSFPYQLGCGGASFAPEEVYWNETGFGGNYLTLSMTPLGLLHSTTCAGNMLALLNIESGKDTLLTGSLSRAILSPDGTHLLAITRDVNGTLTAEARLKLIDLSTLKVNPLATSASPDQVTWANDGTLYYSSRTARASLLTILTDDEKMHLPINVDAKMLQSFDVQVHHLNPATGKDQIIYTADAYAIGRMAVGSDSTLYFSQIAHANEWLKAIGSGTLDLSNDPGGTKQLALLPVTMFSLSANIDSAPVLIGTGYNVFALGHATQITSAPPSTAIPATLVQAGNNPGCQIRLDWPIYTIVREDTLNSIARRVHSTAAALGQANCLVQLNQINVGQTIHVPRLPRESSPTTIITPSPTALSPIAPTAIPATYAAQLISFTTDTPVVKPDGVIMVHWKTVNTTGVTISDGFNFNRTDLPPEGSLAIPAAQFSPSEGKIPLILTARTSGFIVGRTYFRIDIITDSGVVIHSLNANAETAQPGQTITFSWNITGAMQMYVGAVDSRPRCCLDPGILPFSVLPNTTFPTGTWHYKIPEDAIFPVHFVFLAQYVQGWGVQKRFEIR